MNEQFWQNIPKTFCDNANMAITGGIGNTFLLALLSGGNAQAFAFTPEHIKRLSQLINHHVKKYEEKQGLINVETWDPGTKSPFQISDLKDGGGSNSKKK